MKITKVLFLTLAATTMAACSNDKETDITGGKKDLVIKFNLPQQADTRAVEDPVANNATPTLENVTLTFDGGTPDVTLDAATLAAGNVKVQVNEATNNVTKMIANTSADINLADINSFQGKSLITAIPLYAGSTAITKGAENSVTLSPKAYVARMEILNGNSITPTSNKYSDIYVTGVYVNNFYTKIDSEGSSTGNTAQKTSEGDWATYYSSSTASNKMYNEGITTANWTSKCAGYQIFPASTAATLPEITLKLSYTKESSSGQTGYLTIRKFKKGTADLTAMEAGKIYKLDVSSIGSLFKEDGGGTPVDPVDPTPGKPKTDLAITVTVTAWAAESITPNL